MSKEDLKIAIEEIVAPLLADPRLKDRYREELLRHLTELVKDERTRGRDNVKALEAALERLGDPEMLRTNFIDSLSRLDRAYGKAGKFFEKRPDECDLRYAIRCCGSFALGLSVLTTAFFLPATLIIGWFNDPGPGVGPFLSAFGLFLVLYLSATHFFSLLAASRWENALRNRNWGVYAVYGFLVVVLSLVSGIASILIARVLLVWSLGRHHPEVYGFVSVTEFTVFVATAGLITAGTIGVFWIQPRVYTPLPDWPYRSGA